MTEQHSPLTIEVSKNTLGDKITYIRGIDGEIVCSFKTCNLSGAKIVCAVNSYNKMRNLLVLILGGHKPTETEIKTALKED